MTRELPYCGGCHRTFNAGEKKIHDANSGEYFHNTECMTSFLKRTKSVPMAMAVLRLQNLFKPKNI